VAVYDGAKIVPLPDNGGAAAQLTRFFGIDDPSFRGGARPAVADLNGDGGPDQAIGAGFGGGPRVHVFEARQVIASNGSRGNVWANFFAGDSSLRGGVHPLMRDADGDGKAELIVGSGDNEPSRVRVYKAASLFGNPAPDQELDPFGTTLAEGVFVG
jgi:hypothetical protein